MLRRILHVSGVGTGMIGELRIYPRSHSVVAVLANFDPPAASRVVNLFDERMPIK
jgi:hypothetical protein